MFQGRVVGTIVDVQSPNRFKNRSGRPPRSPSNGFRFSRHFHSRLSTVLSSSYPLCPPFARADIFFPRYFHPVVFFRSGRPASETSARSEDTDTLRRPTEARRWTRRRDWRFARTNWWTGWTGSRKRVAGWRRRSSSDARRRTTCEPSGYLTRPRRVRFFTIIYVLLV